MVDGDPTAVGMRRVVGAGLDLMLLGLVIFAVFIVIAERKPNFGVDIGCTGVSQPCVNLGSTTFLLSGARFPLFGASAVALGVLVVGGRRGASGRSVGMDVVGLRLVNANGDPPGAMRGIGRSVLGVVDALPCSLPLVGLTMILVGPRHQRVADRAAGTFVVHERDAGHPVPTRAPVPPDVAVVARAHGPDALTVLSWAGVAIGTGLSALLLAILWTSPLMIDLRPCGSVLSPTGRCAVSQRALAAALLLFFALLPAVFIAWPSWIVGALRRRRRAAADVREGPPVRL